MSDVWEQAASGIDPWTPQDNDQSAALTQVESPSDGDEAHELEDYRPHDTTASSAHACRNCGSPHHLTRMCPENDAPRGRSPGPQDGPRGCYNCGEEGHMKSDCPNPPVFKGTCKICQKEGHMAAKCPSRTPDICKNCLEEGHIAFECKANRKFDLGNVPDVLPEEAWELMKKASDVNDLDDFREAVKMYSKAVPDATWVDIEKKLREGKLRYYLIALIHDTMDVNTLIDLQGKLDRKYAISFQESQTPPRRFLRTRWPESPEDNMERLKDAGLPYDRYVPKCRNCDKMGHIAKHCKEERIEVTHTEIRCANCDELGHRVRDCPVPRKSRFGCRNCGSEEHEARDCPVPRSADDVECRRCNQTGHFAKDCPNVEARPPRTCRNCGSEDHILRDCDQPRVESSMVCRNCDQEGHFSRECPEPKNWSKVKCNRCGEMGHTVKRCPQPEDVGAASRSVTHEGFSKSDNGDDFDITHQLTDLTW